MKVHPNSWVLFDVAGHRCGVQTEYVREMVVLAHVTRVARSPEHVRGVINLRGHVLPVVDMRRLLGARSLHDETEEMVANFAQRKQDHINWLDELRASVREKREFKLTTDPHKCAFGKWYDHFQANDAILSVMLGKFDRPHKKIHAIGEQARHLVAQGQAEEAMRLIDETARGDLAVIIDLFDRTTPLLRAIARETVIVAGYEGTEIGLIVDAVYEVSHVTDDQIQPCDNGAVSGKVQNMLTGIGKLGTNMAMMFDGQRLFSHLVGKNKSGGE